MIQWIPKGTKRIETNLTRNYESRRKWVFRSAGSDSPSAVLTGTVLEALGVFSASPKGRIGALCRNEFLSKVDVHFGLLIGALLFFFPAVTEAHPHMFVDVSAKFVLTDSTLAGFHVYWKFDEMNSAIFTDEYDKNGNNQFEPNEVREVEKGAFLRVADQNYYTAFVWDNKFYKIREFEKFNALVGSDGAVRFSYFVPCNFAMEEIVGKEMTLFFEDPSMYIAFTLQKDLIQVSTNEKWLGKITFGNIDYVECAHLLISAK